MTHGPSLDLTAYDPDDPVDELDGVVDFEAEGAEPLPLPYDGTTIAQDIDPGERHPRDRKGHQL